jgi:hypothetical protein
MNYGGINCSNQVHWTSNEIGAVNLVVDVSKLTKPSYIRLSVWNDFTTSQGWGVHIKLPMRVIGK